MQGLPTSDHWTALQLMSEHRPANHYSGPQVRPQAIVLGWAGSAPYGQRSRQPNGTSFPGKPGWTTQMLCCPPGVAGAAVGVLDSLNHDRATRSMLERNM